jgi:hypothetical protein
MVQDNVSFCPNCGSNNFMYDNQQYTNYNQPQYQNYPYNQMPKSNVGEPIIWGIVGFFVPLAGLVLFLVWKNTNPEQAKASGIGALISVALSILGMFFFANSIFFNY